MVLAQKAYILFYIRDEKDGASWSAPPASPPTPQHSPRGMANVSSPCCSLSTASLRPDPTTRCCWEDTAPAEQLTHVQSLQGEAAPATAPPRPNGIITDAVAPVALANGVAMPASAPAASRRRKAEADDHEPDAQPTAKRRKAAHGPAKAGVLGLSLA